MRVLIVKTTSMGDVVHAVPVVEDIKRFISDAEIDWLVEDSFADIPRHVAGVSEVIECSVRKWKKRIFEKSTRGQIKALCEKLRSKHYDLVIDLQGLIKSAVLASWTNEVDGGKGSFADEVRNKDAIYHGIEGGKNHHGYGGQREAHKSREAIVAVHIFRHE